MPGVPVARARPATTAVHIGRQPIHDATGRLHGYELLFRDTATADEAGQSGDAATTSTILAAFSEFGVADLLGGRLGFINLTRAFLVGELPLPFTPDYAVLEVLETVVLDDEVVRGAAHLVAQGYRLALDDFTWSPAAEPLLELASIVKIDVLALPWEEVLATAQLCAPHGVQLLAEKVEDAEMLRRCVDAGFTLFQGYHVGRPETLSLRTLSPTQALTLELIGRLGDPTTSTAEVEEAVSSDPALAYRLLRIANSAASGLARPVSSVRDALVLVGLAKLRGWLVLLAMSPDGGLGERVTDALARGRVCERIAKESGLARPDVAFTLGLLDGIAEALGVPHDELLERMPALAHELADALRGVPGPLRRVLDTVLAYERRDLTALQAAPLALPRIADAYLAALAWTSETTRAIAPASSDGLGPGRG